MKIIWQQNKIFKEKFIVIGDWNFSSCDKFTHCDYVSADTETKLYYNNELLTEEKAHKLYKENGAKWCRCNIVVKPYAFMLSDGKSFALFQNIEDFLLCCAMMLVKIVFWYNAKFDFAIFDYYFLTNGWERSENAVKEFDGNRHKLPHKTFQSLDGDFGQRYQLRIWQEYKNKKWNRKVHNFKMIDICNIFAGGLRKNLEDWKIVDKSGEEVRKLHMDYVNASIENDIEYMIADTKGLHLLAEKINETVKEISGFSLFGGEFITAGGLAKKSLLKYMFKEEKTYDNIKLFKKYFPMTKEKDQEYRDLKLYQGGKCFVSPYKVNTIVKNIYKYDINSMYPTQMRNMLYPVGEGKKVNKINKKGKNKIYILKISNIYGTLKENMVPVWYDSLTADYKMNFFEEESRYIWLEEIEEYENYYDLIYSIDEILEFEGYKVKGAEEYVDNYYKIKKTSKGAIKNGAKLFLNSAYGKLAQRIERANCHYELSEEGYVHLVQDEIEIDEKNMLSVLVGSRITSLSRVLLCYYIRKICKGNPKKYFVYCDTDSVHALCNFEDTNDTELGKMKNEGIYEFGKYLAPKTYLLYNSYEKKGERFEVHSKGVNTQVVKDKLEECNDFYEASKLFASGINYQCLTSLNCIGGKALIYIDKMLLNPKLEKIALGNDELED